jgi:hypothetical protein
MEDPGENLTHFIFFITTIAIEYLIGDHSLPSATPAAFAAMWTCLVLIVLSVMGTIIMRKVSYVSHYYNMLMTVSLN